jgi:putative FmdB family regulatory protein
MPLYEYQCDGKCGQRFEKIRKFSDPPLEKCPTCGGPIHKLQSSPAFQFKGSGFYITDYGKKDSDLSGKADKAEKAEKTEKAKSEKSDKSEKKDTGSSTTETKSSSDKTEKPAEKKSTEKPAKKD